jgi:AraC family transcriptional regulator
MLLGMSRRATQDNYVQRLGRVAAHIAEHLDEPLDLEQLASVACLSPYHFHRLYRAVWGETAAETLLRLRLSRAALELLETPIAITSVGRRAGYRSLAAFSRAFKASYGEAPSSFRAGGALIVRGGFRNTSRRRSPMAVTIEERAPMRFAYLTHIGPHKAIGRTFEKLYAWASPRSLTGAHAVGLAVYLDDANAVPAAELRSEAGVSVAEEVEGGGEVRVRTLPGGRYAVQLLKGPYAGLDAAYRNLFAWLAGSGERRADAPIVEVYLNDPHTTAPADLVTEICLPLL